MRRGVVRAAAYQPRFTDGRRRVGANDEDVFTYVATALERAVRREAPDLREQTMRLLGTTETIDPEALAAVLGAPVRWVSEPTDVTPSRAVELAMERSDPHWIVAVQPPESDARSVVLGPPGEGALAVLFDHGTDVVPWKVGEDAGREGTHEGPFVRLLAAGRALPSPSVRLGDWTADPTDGRAAPSRTPPHSGPPPFTVSEGAFVPTARYEESRPSRWGFVADRCEACGARTFPSRGRCRVCGGADQLRRESLPLGGATVVAVTQIGPGGQPTEFDLQMETSGPYGVVLAEVAPDVRVTLTVADALPGEIRVGSKVDTALRRLYPIEGSWRYGRKAVPPSGP